MKKGLLIVVLIVALCAWVAVSTYNSLVTAQEKVSSSYADIDTQLQRRADLIPNLVNTVKGYMEHEQGIIDSITESRDRLLNAGSVQDRADANEALTTALGQFFVIAENYPDLKANENFIALQDELAGTENRIATARKDYDQAVSEYNAMIRRFPAVLFVQKDGFEKAEYFEAAKGSDVVPEVNF